MTNPSGLEVKVCLNPIHILLQNSRLALSVFSGDNVEIHGEIFNGLQEALNRMYLCLYHVDAYINCPTPLHYVSKENQTINITLKAIPNGFLQPAVALVLSVPNYKPYETQTSDLKTACDFIRSALEEPSEYLVPASQAQTN
jgi:hypothetical protein